MNEPLPFPIDGFVDEVLAAITKRSRAIKHTGARLSFGDGTPTWEETHEDRLDAGRAYIDLVYTLEGQRVRLRVLVWPDRWVWIDCRRATKRGWAWACTLEGRLLEKDGGRFLIEQIEQASKITRGTGDIAAQLRLLWSAYLATGPRLV